MIDATTRVDTSGRVHAWAAGNDYRCAWLAECVGRHTHGDWGTLDDHDHAANTQAITTGTGRIVSAYPVPGHLAGANPDPAVWIITDDLDDPNPATTILWPSDY